MKSLFDGNGGKLSHSWVHVPLAYTSKILPKGKQLCIVEMSKNKVVTALRSGTGFTIGMMKHRRLFKDRTKGKYFNFKGKKMFIKDIAVVF
jgi:hypothetical protein